MGTSAEAICANSDVCIADKESVKKSENKKKSIDVNDSHKKKMWNLYTSLYGCMTGSDIPLELKLSCCGTVLAQYAVLAGVSGTTVTNALRKSYDHFQEKKQGSISVKGDDEI